MYFLKFESIYIYTKETATNVAPFKIINKINIKKTMDQVKNKIATKSISELKNFINRVKEMINEKPFVAGFISGGIITLIILMISGMF